MSPVSLLTSLSGLWAMKADALTSLTDGLQHLADAPPGMAAAAQRLPRQSQARANPAQEPTRRACAR